MGDGTELHLDKATRRRIGSALARTPQGLYILTSADEQRCGAVLVSWVQQVAFDPPMVMVALRKGRHIVPLIHDSHAFALNQIAKNDRLLLRKFARPVDDDDPLQGIDTTRKATGSPLIQKSLCYLDCELIRHIDIEADHDLYVGMVRDAAVLHNEKVPIHLRDDGFNY